jgi:hypothetical protein
VVVVVAPGIGSAVGCRVGEEDDAAAEREPVAAAERESAAAVIGLDADVARELAAVAVAGVVVRELVAAGHGPVDVAAEHELAVAVASAVSVVPVAAALFAAVVVVLQSRVAYSLEVAMDVARGVAGDDAPRVKAQRQVGEH